MSSPTKVLFWGTAQEGPCAYFRGYMFDPVWREMGIEPRHISSLKQIWNEEDKGIPEHRTEDRENCCDFCKTQIDSIDKDPWNPTYLPVCLCPECQKYQVDAVLSKRVQVDTEPLEWCDVVVFRRYYNISRACRLCSFITRDADAATTHMQTMPGHMVPARDNVTQSIWDAFNQDGGRGIIYETDDHHFFIQKWNGYYPDVVNEHPLIREMSRRADLITVSTTPIGQYYGRYNPRVRVIRNAIDPSLYTTDTPHPGGDKPRLLYYGADARMRDYAVDIMTGALRPAYRAVRDLGGFQRVFIGWTGDEGMKEIWDELVPYIKSIPGFAKAMADSHPDIGIAPLGGDEFDRAKSELHWLEYSLVGAATIAERFSGPGPYSMIRNGIDGIQARGPQAWYDGLKKLRDNPNFRADLAAAAKERVLAEYDYRKRAEEWADAFRWASENRGIGLAQNRS